MYKLCKNVELISEHLGEEHIYRNKSLVSDFILVFRCSKIEQLSLYIKLRKKNKNLRDKNYRKRLHRATDFVFIIVERRHLQDTPYTSLYTRHTAGPT